LDFLAAAVEFSGPGIQLEGTKADQAARRLIHHEERSDGTMKVANRLFSRL
jgi:hypothetical protein